MFSSLSEATKLSKINEVPIALLQITPIDEAIDPSEWEDWLVIAQLEDVECQEIKRGTMINHRMRDGLLRRVCPDDGDDDRVVVPHSVAWRLIQAVHKFLVHFGTDKVLDFVRDHFYIKHVHELVRDVVASCEVCQATKVYTRATTGPQYYEEPEDCGELISLDLFGPLPRSENGYNYVLVLLDMFNKLTTFYPLPNQKVESIIRCLEEDYFPQRGIKPRVILTDCGGQFLTNAWREFARRNGCELRRTTPYNSQFNPIKRVMRELGRCLRVYAHHEHTAWDAVIP